VRDNFPVLLHCHQGVSRSASVVIDYVASAKQVSADSAMDLVRCSRSIVRPNAGVHDAAAAAAPGDQLHGKVK
jgi:protein-tyrosine phosphatase